VTPAPADVDPALVAALDAQLGHRRAQAYVRPHVGW
jgi:hypothetical protein